MAILFGSEPQTTMRREPGFGATAAPGTSQSGFTINPTMQEMQIPRERTALSVPVSNPIGRVGTIFHATGGCHSFARDQSVKVRKFEYEYLASKTLLRRTSLEQQSQRRILCHQRSCSGQRRQFWLCHSVLCCSYIDHLQASEEKQVNLC